MGEVDKEAPSSVQEAEVLYPGFSTIAYGDRRTPEELRIGTPLFRNEGFVQVALHVHSFACLFRRAGLIPQEINEIELVFRPATMAERDFFGEHIGGASLLGGGFVEVYTTALADRKGACHTHIPMRRSGVVTSVLHETDHIVRARKGEVDEGTFSVPHARRGQIIGEQQAGRFAQEQLPRFANKLVIREDPLFPFRDNTGERIIGELAGLEWRFDLDRRIEVWVNDWPPLDLWEEFRRKFLQPEDISRIPAGEIEGFLGRARRLAREKWLGVAEYNYIVGSLRVAAAERGTSEQTKALVDREIKPDQIKFLRKKAPWGSRAAVWLAEK